jgi:hypothetical protein
LLRHLTVDAAFLLAPAHDSDVIGELKAGDALMMLDNSRGWAWGYAPDGRVGYLPSAAVAA